MDPFKILLVNHIVAGTVAFIVAPVALIVKKGGASHRFWGKVFFYSMLVVAITALIMAPMHNNLFLTLVAVFSFYLAFSGYRAIYRKSVYRTGKAPFIDWFFAGLNGLFSASLFVLGILRLPGAFGIISIVFGAIGSWLSIRDIISYLKPSNDKQKWLFAHMIGMIAAYISALSAFSAVNLNFEWLHPAIQWLWPTIVGVPVIIVWTNYYRGKFAKGKKVKEVLEVKILAGEVNEI